MLARVLLVAVLALPSLANAQTAELPATTADVVAWNFSGFQPIPAERQDQLVRVLEDLDAEVIVAVEVNPDRVLHDVASELTERGVCHNSVMPDQTARQNIGVIFKCGVQVTNPRFVPNSDDGNSSLRRALAVDVRVGQFDFILIGLHLKAGRSSSDRAIRDRQVDHIAAFVAAETTGGERDVLVVGDYNMIPGEDASNFQKMNPAGFLRFVSSEDLAGEFSHLSGSGCAGGNLLDGFAVSRDHTGEYIEASLRIYPMHREREMSLCEFRDDVSDHLPVIARFRVTTDDDGAGAVAGAGTLRIVAVLPNPDGIDHSAEQVTLENSGAVAMPLHGWRIADDDGNEVSLSGSIGPGTTAVITLDHPAMLNNDGDVVRLLSPTLEEHQVTYTVRAVSGQTLQCGADGVCN